jgi:ABC-type glycerol-3-phosphate transport system substrate-binding protein
MKRKVLVLAAVILMITVLQVQAGGRRDSSSSGTSGQAVEVSAVFQLNPEIVLENNPVIKMMEEDLNIRLKIEAPPQNSYGDRVKILASTGSMPDLVHYGADISATQWAQEGLILDVTDRIAQYPNLKANISLEQYGDCVFLPDGRIYGVPRPNSFDKFGFIINKKWLDKLGLKPPKTVAEFVEVCRAFTLRDPDGNGRNDTYGVSFNASQSSLNSGIWHLQNDFFSMAYSISAWHAGMPDSDGSAKIKALKKQYPDYMKQLHDMYQEGIIDREFITHNASENYEKIAQNRVGIVGASEKNYNTGILERYSMNIDDFVYCPPLVLNASQRPVYAMPPSNWMAYYINASSSATRQDAALRVLDWGNSEKGFIAMQLGIQGTHYNSYDLSKRMVTRTPAQVEAVRKVTSNMFGFANAYKGEEALAGGATPAQIAKWQVEARAADAATTKCYFGFTKMLDEIGVQFPDVEADLSSLEVRYITGEVPYERLDTFIRNTLAPKTAAIQKEFADYMAANPARYVD